MAYKKLDTVTLATSLANDTATRKDRVIHLDEQDGAVFSCSDAVALTFYHGETPEATFGAFAIVDWSAPSATPVAVVFTPEAGKWYNWPAAGNAGHYWQVLAASGTPVLKVASKRAARS